jgi:hypothetical protein
MVRFIVTDTIGPELDRRIISTVPMALAAMQEASDRVEGYAQSNAPWTDITGAARSSLTASVYEENGEVVLELAHGVDYGYWLEVIQDGQYAIIMPTLEALGPEVLTAAGAAVIAGGELL